MAAETMNPWPIAPVTPNDLNFAVVNYDFVSFTANEQSELPSLEGAIDISLLDFAASIADQTILIASLFDGLDDLGLIPGEIDSSDNIGSTLGDLANAAAAGDAALGDYANQIGGSTGGGGSGGGGTSGGCVSIAFGAQKTVVNGSDASYTKTWTLQNNGSNPITIKSGTFNPPAGLHFLLSPLPYGRTIQPGAQLIININFSPEFPGEYHTTLTLQTDAPDPQPCAQLSGTGIGAPRLG